MRPREILCAVTAGLLLVTGCTTTRTYAPTSDAGTRELKIQAGDRLRVVTTRRERVSFEVTEIRDDRFVGVTFESVYRHRNELPGGKTVEVPFDELAVLQVTRYDAGRTALATAFVVVTVSAIGAVMGASGGIPAAAAPGAP